MERSGLGETQRDAEGGSGRGWTIKDRRPSQNESANEVTARQSTTSTSK